jgi:hypothetical protein
MAPSFGWRLRMTCERRCFTARQLPSARMRSFREEDAVRVFNLIIVLALTVAGCAVSTRPQALGYSDYVGLSCPELAAETKRLVREKTNRSEHLLENDEARRQTATMQLAAAKKAIADKRS